MQLVLKVRDSDFVWLGEGAIVYSTTHALLALQLALFVSIFMHAMDASTGAVQLARLAS